MARISDLPLRHALMLRVYPWRRIDPVPRARRAKPLAASRVALVTTAGLVPPLERPFDPDVKGGDFSFRVIGSDASVRGLEEHHRSDTFDHTGIRRDPNVAFPLDRLRELAATGEIGEVGRVVADETIRAILRPGHADNLLLVERRFCKTPRCAVLYYGADGRVVEKGAASVRVGETGESTIPDRIDAEIRAGRCACERKNPSGACCLGDVRKAVKEAKAALAAARGS